MPDAPLAEALTDALSQTFEPVESKYGILPTWDEMEAWDRARQGEERGRVAAFCGIHQ